MVEVTAVVAGAATNKTSAFLTALVAKTLTTGVAVVVVLVVVAGVEI